ncbi:MAG TPA: tetratricopeptide repeat protein [Pyrinomonadaceae bacterium]|nr:tetratricopeptide repeat protein [Pyrinomonadaceae bacterium]
MKTQNTRNNHQSPVVSEKDVFNLLGQAKHLEFCRQVDKAMDVLRPVWGDINKPPAADGYSPTVRGEILLRCGSLLSYYSHYKQFEGQEMSRDWLTEAVRIFKEGEITDKAAEAETELAMTYWREGRYSEALIFLQEASSKVTNDLNAVNIKNIAYQLIVHFVVNTAESLQAAAALIKEKDIYVELCLDNRAKVHYYNNSALIMTRCDQMAEALKRHELTIHFCREVGNQFTLAIAENNIGYIYREFKQFDKALEHCNRSLQIFGELGATARQGEVLDTLAQIYLERQVFLKGDNFEEALHCIEKSLAIWSDYPFEDTRSRTGSFKHGTNYPSLINSLQTKARILLHKGEIPEAVMLFSEFYQTAKIHHSEAAAEGYARDFCKYFYIPSTSSFEDASRGFEKNFIENALLESGMMISKAAEKLNLPEEKLVKLLADRHSDLRDKYGIDLELDKLGKKSSIAARRRSKSLKAAKTAETEAPVETLVQYQCNGFPVFIPSTVEVGRFMPISETRLKSVGLIEGRVAVVRSRYDPNESYPIVLREFLSSNISYGFRIDACGLIGLEFDDPGAHQPLAFSHENVEILGNIIGYCEFNFKTKMYEYHPLKTSV